MIVLSLLFTSFIAINNVGLTNNSNKSVINEFVEQHPNILEYSYNECSHVSTYDDESKSWFALEKESKQRHFPHSNVGISTIKYYVSDTSLKDSSLTWSYNMPDSTLGEQVKQNFLNSILKWNNFILLLFIKWINY